MKRFEQYVSGLEQLADSALRGRLSPEDRSRIIAALDGEVSDRLRSKVGLTTRRRLGAFFTTGDLRKRIVNQSADAAGPCVMDFTCGAGDLLIEYTQNLRAQSSLLSTVRAWGAVLHGFDREAEFVRAARARLVLAAALRTPPPKSPNPPRRLSNLFPNLRVADGLMELGRLTQPITFLLNPPFTRIPAPKDCQWADGSISSAALFLMTCIESAPPGSVVTAILPDVLRTGSRYRKWRGAIACRASLEQVDVCGRFSEDADIDVFIARLRIRAPGITPSSCEWWQSSSPSGTKIGTLFECSVGSVVPHRDPRAGPRVPFIFARALPAWSIYDDHKHYRRFAGRAVLPPFVAVRRTSSPRDKYRAVGTIVLGTEPVAVENHLLVLRPLDGSKERCVKLLRVLRSTLTNDWFNQRIRCRHLTVEAIREAPWFDETEHG